MASDNTSKPKPILITFDVDGTLIRAVGSNANKWHKDAFAFAMHEVFSIDTNIDVIKHHGSTDQLVLADVLKHHGFEETEIWRKMDELKSAMVSFAEEHKADAGLGLEILPGVEKLLQTLSERENIIVALVTGNLEPIAWRKMDTLGIKKYFTEKKNNFIGGFGSDHTERSELIKFAAQRSAEAFDLNVSEMHKPGAVFKERAHFGDTPNDVTAALDGGAIAIALETGVFSGDELQKHFTVPIRCHLLKDLTDTDAVLHACGLPEASEL